MVLKLTFYNKQKNNELWWNRLWDRFNKSTNRIWTVKGGCLYGSESAEFEFKHLDGTDINDQHSVNEIIWIFVMEQLNIKQFFINGVDVTNDLTHR